MVFEGGSHRHHLYSPHGTCSDVPVELDTTGDFGGWDDQLLASVGTGVVDSTIGGGLDR